MKDKEQEYRELFQAEALSNFEEINRLLTHQEKNLHDKQTVHALFRITHTLKGNAAGMGYTPIAEMAHVLEDFFGEVRDGKIIWTTDIFSAVYKGVDVLGSLINAISTKDEVKYKGIKTKLEVLIRRTQTQDAGSAAPSIPLELEPLSPFVPEQVNLGTTSSGSEEVDVPGEVDAKVTFSDLVQVPVRKLDNLLNLVGELIIEKDRILATHGGTMARGEYARLSRISSDLQYSVMDVRLVQVGFLFNKFHRVVRDAAAVEQKTVVLKLEGTDAEIDRNVLQVMSDALIHLIRNAVGHGIERAEERVQAGKPEAGTVYLRARNDTDAVIITIEDDGKGLDYNRIKEKAIGRGLINAEAAALMTQDDLGLLIFEPGFSTAEHITSIAGRGVGMDVVKRTLDTIGGTISMKSVPGAGTTIQLTLPSSMAVKSCLLLELEQETYAIPLAYTDSVIALYRHDVHQAAGGLVASHLGKNISIAFLSDILHDEGTRMQHGIMRWEILHPEQKLEIVVVTYNGRTVGFVVDKLLQQKEIVEKPLAKPVDQVRCVSGVTILGSGRVCLVLHIPNLLQSTFSLSGHRAMRNSLSLN